MRRYLHVALCSFRSAFLQAALQYAANLQRLHVTLPSCPIALRHRLHRLGEACPVGRPSDLAVSAS